MIRVPGKQVACNSGHLPTDFGLLRRRVACLLGSLAFQVRSAVAPLAIRMDNRYLVIYLDTYVCMNMWRILLYGHRIQPPADQIRPMFSGSRVKRARLLYFMHSTVPQSCIMSVCGNRAPAPTLGNSSQARLA